MSEKSTTPKKEGRYWHGNGRRKTSVAQVRLFDKGTGEITINDRPINEYFTGTLIGNAKHALKVAGLAKRFDITVIVKGGGISSQSDAVRHGISRALIAFDTTLRQPLKAESLLTRDARVKERKKYGLKRARRAPQFSKR
jgi:small subunit ribosomal protein S9